MADLSHLYNFTLVDDRLCSSGQPRAEQFAEIRQAGFDAVINLTTFHSEKALPNEADLVAEQGMDYVHIPVDWDNPEKEDFEQFSQAMNARADKRVFVHCAANMRGTAFVFLYRIIHQGVDPSEAKETMRQIWDPYGIWLEFVEEVLSDHDVDYYDID